ncbi:HipA N-terminal domain-containing protein [Rahnella woolbedingensis]|uniref:Type II toxin-antitoxin system HipA family toxin n=1 Tax=Rahnella woolbedingensis TaxID=1510574 RepID=A0A419N3D5_9GAMM|nr:HipA N-terminal domain-containing protein [Rahnella woolbedingensis]RJT37424.1 type II toxin-antitoxin system HipA family toxin [Rahnella woolbedingensis]
MARKIEVWLYGEAAGVLSERESKYAFSYYAAYMGPALSLSMPVRIEPYLSQDLHPFFKGLAPEGWLRKRYSEIQKIDSRDLFGLLMHNGDDLLGAVVIKEMK